MISKSVFINCSITTRLLVWLGAFFVLFFSLLIGANKFFKESIETRQDDARAERDVKILFDIVNFKYLISQELADDYSYWRAIVNLVNENNNDAVEYERLLGGVAKNNFAYIAVHNSKLEMLYEKASLTLERKFSTKRQDIDNLKVFGEINHKIESRDGDIYIVSYRPVFFDSFDKNPTGYLTLAVVIERDFLKQIEGIVNTKFRLIYDDSMSNESLLFNNGWVPKTVFENMTESDSTKLYTFRVYNQGNRSNLKLQVTLPKESYYNKVVTLLFTTQLCGLLGLFFYVLFLIRKFVSNPVERMNCWLKGIGVNKADRFEYYYNDEIGQLACNILENQNRLSDSIKAHDSLLNAISDVIITIDDKFLVSYCNPKAELWFELTGQCIVGQDVDFLVRLEKGSIEKLVKYSLKREKEHSYSVRLAPLGCREEEYFESSITITKLDDTYIMLVFRFDVD